MYVMWKVSIQVKIANSFDQTSSSIVSNIMGNRMNNVLHIACLLHVPEATCACTRESKYDSNQIKNEGQDNKYSKSEASSLLNACPSLHAGDMLVFNRYFQVLPFLMLFTCSISVHVTYRSPKYY